MKLVDQWRVVEENLPQDWDEVRLTLTTESPGDLPRAAQVLGPLTPGRAGSALVLHVRRAGGASGPEAARRLFDRLDRDRVWCHIAPGEVSAAPADTGPAAVEAQPLAEQLDAELARLPGDWSDVLAEIELDSSDYLDRGALLCAPVNPSRDGERLAFLFRCARRAGYGVAPAMARRCLERCDAEGITGRVRVLRVLSDTDNVATQGPVWLVGGRVL
jgi:hypothetical protein